MGAVKGELNSILFESITWAVVELSLISIQIQIKVYLALIGIGERRILAAGKSSPLFELYRK